jgi:hypothetical protein
MDLVQSIEADHFGRNAASDQTHDQFFVEDHFKVSKCCYVASKADRTTLCNQLPEPLEMDPWSFYGDSSPVRITQQRFGIKPLLPNTSDSSILGRERISLWAALVESKQNRQRFSWTMKHR